MKAAQIKILADENISPKVVAYLRKLNLDVKDVKEEGWCGKTDSDFPSMCPCMSAPSR